MKRNVNIDLLKFLGLVCLVIVHFFFNNSFSKIKLDGFAMNFAAYINLFCSFQLPLFLVISGYLMTRKKQYNINYFKKLIKVLISYFLINVFVIITEMIICGRTFIINELLFGFIFGTIGYSWYVLLYCQLYLLMPIINKIYDCLKNKTIYIIFLLILINTILYSIGIDLPLRLFNFWQLSYVLMGIYLKNNKINIRKFYLLICVFSVSLIQFLLFRLTNNEPYYIYNYFAHYGSFNIFIIVLCIFLLVLNINVNKINNSKFLNIVTNSADNSLELYMGTRIFDVILYKLFTFLSFSVKFIFIIFFVIAIYSLSYIFSLVYNKLYYFIKERVLL